MDELDTVDKVRNMIKWLVIGVFAAIMLVVVVGTFSIVGLTWIDEACGFCLTSPKEISTGNAYGFQIGQSRSEVIEVLDTEYTGELYYLESDYGISNSYWSISVTNEALNTTLARMERWTFYFGLQTGNWIEFSFCEDTLCLIRRKRFTLEGP